jgi:hypothetical protein
MRKGFPWFEVLLGIVFLSATVYAAFSDAYNLPNRWFIRDDAYYYFKVAQNISEGHGSTFDGIHLTNGYHPLWLLICIPIFALARYDLILPLRILAIVTGVLQFGTAVLLHRLLRKAISPAAGMLAAAYWLFNSYILLFLYKTGVESGVALLLLVGLLYMLYKFDTAWSLSDRPLSKIALLSLVALLTTFGRLDLAFAVIVIGIWIVFRGSALRYLLPLDALAIIVAGVSAFLARLGFTAYYDAVASVEIMLVVAVLVTIPILFLLGLHSSPSTLSPLSTLGRLTLASIGSSLVSSVILLAGSALGLLPPYSRFILLLYAALSLGFLLVIRVGVFALRQSTERSPSLSPIDLLRSSWKRWLYEGALYYGILGAGMALYMIWNRLAFGTFTPVSGQIKHWWGTFVHSIYGTNATSWLTFFALNPFSDFNAWAPPTTAFSNWSNGLLYKEATGFGNPRWQQNFVWVLLIAVALTGIILLLRRKKSVRAMIRAGMLPLFVGSWMQILAYNVPGYASPKEWYWITEQVFLVILGAAMLNVLFELLSDRWRYARLLIWLFVVLASARAGYAYWRDTYALNPYGTTAANTPYVDVIPVIESATQPGDVIGMTGGGNVGYLMPSRIIVNMDGLINSYDYFQALQAGTGADYLYNSGMRYVFANPELLAANPYRGQYEGRLALVFHWGGKDLMRLLAKSDPAP